MVLLASIYAEFSMQHFHTLALINPQPAALVNMQADPLNVVSCRCHTVGTYKPMHTPSQARASRSAIENHCALVNDTFVDQRVRGSETTTAH